MSDNLIDLRKRIPARYFHFDLESFGAAPPDEFLYRLDRLLFRSYLYSVRPAEVVALDPGPNIHEIQNWAKDQSSTPGYR